MVNLIPMPNTIEKLKGKVSFSNYQLMIENKYEKAILLFNHELESKLIIDETKPCYDFEFIFNNKLANEQYIILMDKEVTHVEASSERGFFYASRTLAQLFDLFNTKKVKKITSLAYYIDDKPRFAYRSFMMDVSRGEKIH